MSPSFRVWVRNNLFVPYKTIVASGEIRRYLASTDEPKLNLGAGGNRLPGWLNVDLFPPPNTVYMNGARRWPFPNGTFHALFCEHMIEHVSKTAGRHVIREAFRTTRPGGKFRVVTPDLDFFAGAVLNGAPYADGYLRFIERFTKTEAIDWCDAINFIFYEHGHRYIYSRAELKRELEAAGFVGMTELRAGHYDDPIFDGVDGHPALVGREPNAIEAFAIETRKPA
jgi:predicted SAM-dependent methyltransferase